MRKTNFTFLTQQLKNLLIILFVVGINASMDAQGCSLVCNGGINVSLDGTDCDVTLKALDLLNGEESTCELGFFDENSVHILDHHGNFINDTGHIGWGYVGETLQFKVVEASGNSCWGYVKVEDKFPPIIDCEQPRGPFYCYDLIDYEPTIFPDCDKDDVSLDIVSEFIMYNDCMEYLPDTLMRITRTYVATDLSGNQSDPCTIEIFVLRLPGWNGNAWAGIMCPPSLLKNTGNALECDYDYPKDENGHPSPIGNAVHDGTGVPVFDHPLWGYIDLYPDGDQFCNLLVDYEDNIIADDGCVIKIMRKWSIIEWSCESPQRIMECYQVIEIVDTKGPNVEVPDDITASTGDYQCAADVYIPAINPIDNCSEEVTVTLSWDGGIDGFNPDWEGGFIHIDTGITVLTFIAYDECGNSSSDDMEVYVEDKTPPVAICDQYTVVSLTSDGVAWAYANVFDDGSYDECKLGKMEVRRMDSDFCDEDEDGDHDDYDEFGEYIKLCCDDVGRTDIMVVFRVYDKAGNHNDCMVNVEVQDKLPPSIVCPPNLTVECGIDFADYSIFGEVQEDKEDVEDIVIHPDYLNGWGGNIDKLTDGYAEDNCEVVVTKDEGENINQCNLGYIVRVFTATDAGERTAKCTQTIEIENTDPFVYEDIYWPLDTILPGCQDPLSDEFHPDNLGFPGFDEDECDLIGSSYEDHVFPFNNSEGEACFKILRKWKVIDWCQFDDIRTDMAAGEPHNYYWDRTQVIKVHNEIDPFFIGTYDPVQVCTYDPTCTDGFVELNASGADDCTTTLKASYKIDIDNDGSFDIFSQDVLGTVVENSISATGTYAIGSHRIEWTFIDFCGNKSSRDQLFDIVNCKAPTPYCLDGLAVDLMPMDFNDDGLVDGGMVELWANDFDAGSYHSCAGYEVLLSFSADTSHRSMVFDCSHVGDREVTIYASVETPMGDLVQSFCITSLSVQDNNLACDGLRVGVSGMIATEDQRRVEDVSVALLGSELTDETTNANGQYAFMDMPAGGTYQVVPQKNDDPTNGLSTLDLVYIQRHILGIAAFDSPYKLIAADINDDGKIAASDILELRKLILGINDDFINNTSWKFVDGDYAFANAEDALDLGYPESYDISTLENSMVINFYGIKVGDVNDNATTNKFDRGSTTRSNDKFNLAIDNVTFADGDVVSIDVRAGDESSLMGLQATLSIDPAYLEVVGIQSGGLDMTDSNFNLNNTSKGLIPLSWNASEAIAFDQGEVLFTLELQANRSGNLTNTVGIIDNPLTAEAYNNVQEVLGLGLQINNIEDGEFQLLQNTPNPFNDVTEIGFILPNEMNVTLTVYDVTGKTISVVNDRYQAGKNTVKLTRNELNTTGVLYYQLEAGTYTATKKMVILR